MLNLLWISLLIIAIYAGFWFWASKQMPDGWGDTGTFGDTFGALNTLFSGLAFAALIFTAWMQTKELSLQRQELEMTRSELKGQKDALNAQNALIGQQQFEATFFQLLALLRQTRDEVTGQVKVVSEGLVKELSGVEYFVFLIKDIEAFLNGNFRPVSYQSRRLKMNDELIGASSTTLDSAKSNLDAYFSTLLAIIRFIRKNEVGRSDIYSKLILAQMSVEEKILLLLIEDRIFNRIAEVLEISKDIKYKLYSKYGETRLYKLMVGRHIDSGWNNEGIVVDF